MIFLIKKETTRSQNTEKHDYFYYLSSSKDHLINDTMIAMKNITTMTCRMHEYWGAQDEKKRGQVLPFALFTILLTLE